MKKLLIVLLILFVAIQFIRPERNISATNGIEPNDISKKYGVPSEVYSTLKTSCFDCHSNNTVYPGYASVQPLAWWINHHINEGKHTLNFSEFASYRINRQYRKLDNIIEQIKENEMPLSSYTIIHKNAVLNDTQRQSIMNWATALMDSIKATNPPDSFKRK